MLHNETEENIQAFKKSKNLANSVMSRQKRLAENKAIEDIENYKMNLRLFFKQCKSVKEGY
jgi:cytochrome c553